jgi:phosphomannomutase
VTTISQVPQPTQIVFGTDGWRARVADEFTFESVRRCADGVARYVVNRGEQAKGVVIAYDRRFASEHFAATAAEVLLAQDIPVAFARHAVPTQMSSYEVVERSAAAGIVITASHNPWTDNGFKVKAPTGSAAGPEILAVLEATIATNGGMAIERRPFADAEAAGLIDWYDPYSGYEQYVRRTVDIDALKAADVHVLVDPMYGAGAGWLPRLLAGGRIRVHEIHTERNPYFGGINPEPIRPNVDEALGILAKGGYDLGLLLDGDADRAGAADERGTFIHQLEVTGLLMYYLAEHRGWRDPVVESVNNTAMALRLGKHYDIPVYETSVGFKYIGPKMIETGAMMGAEESGGYGFGMHLPERDGIYADLLLLDLFLREKAAGRAPVSSAIAAFHELAGPSYYRRIDVHVDQNLYPAIKDRLLAELRANAPQDLAGQPVARTDALTTNDGFKFFTPDGSWMLIRFSGTEPLVRVYTEAVSADVRDAMVKAGEALVRAA